MIEAGRHTIVPEDFSTHVQVSIGAFCSIASGVRVVSGQHPGVVDTRAISDFPFREHGWGEYPASDMGTGVEIGHDVWVGQEAMLLDGIKLGHGCRIGAGAVVTRDVEPYAVMAGNPAMTIDMRFGPGSIDKLLEIAWWEWSDDEIKAALPQMAHIGRFTERYYKGLDN